MASTTRHSTEADPLHWDLEQGGRRKPNPTPKRRFYSLAGSHLSSLMKFDPSYLIPENLKRANPESHGTLLLRVNQIAARAFFNYAFLRPLLHRLVYEILN